MKSYEKYDRRDLELKNRDGDELIADWQARGALMLQIGYADDTWKTMVLSKAMVRKLREFLAAAE